MAYARPPKDAIQRWQRRVGASPDGNPGNETFTKTIAFLDALEDEQPTKPGTPESKRLAGPRTRIMTWAESFVGEVDPDHVWRLANSPHMCGNPSGISWCGGWTLAGLVQNLPACKAWKWKSSKLEGYGFVLPYKLPVTSTPEPGDIVVWRRVPPGYVGGVYSSGSTTDTWHHAFFERNTGTHIWTYDGNVLRAPKEGVAICERVANYGPTSPYRPAFYSIAGLLP